MEYKVDFDSLDALYNSIGKQANTWQKNIENLGNACTVICESTNMSGAAADSIREYINSVHGTIQRLLLQLISLHASNCLLYKQDYQSNIDTDLHAEIQSSVLSDIKTRLNKQRTCALNVDEEIHYALRGINDIFYVSFQNISNVDSAHKKVTNFLTNLDQDINKLEKRHTGTDFVSTGEMISKLTGLIQEQMSQGRTYKTDFSIKDFANTEAFRQVYATHLAVSKELEDKSAAIETAIENEQQRVAALQKEYEERQEQANVVKWIVTGVCIVGSIVAIVATGGTATPLVVGAISATSGAVIAGTNNLADQYVVNGNLRDTDWGSFGTDVLIGGVTGFVTGYVGAGVGNAITSNLSKTAIGTSLLQSSNAAVRIGTGAVIGSVSEVGSGVVSRGTAAYITSGGDLEETFNSAFDGQSIVYDAVLGGVSGGLANRNDPGVKISDEGGSKTINQADRNKIDDWDYTPDDELYIKYKDVFDNPKYYNQETGAINWPENNGFANTPVDEVLQPGTRIDRYGSDYGSFTSPEGTPYEMRAVAPGTDSKPYSVFEVVEPIGVKSGNVAPWFDAPGGGTQYLLPDTVDELLAAGILRRIK